MVGHNWGREHAERWIWLHATAFADAPGAWLEVALGRIKIAGRTTPWVANGALALDGERLRLGGLRRAADAGDRGPSRPTSRSAAAVGVRVHVAVRAPERQTVGWIYADPAGGAPPRRQLLDRGAHPARRAPRPPALELATAHGAAYELGTRER
jgi:hypothetical protein